MTRAMLRADLLGFAIISLLFVGCEPQQSSGAPESYLENGVAWAFGSVQLSAVDAPGTVLLKRLPSDQDLDARRFRLFAAITAEANVGAAERELAYVDYHPVASRLLAFNYQLDFQERPTLNAQAPKVVDAYAVLRKGGRSYFGRQRVYLGFATFHPGAEQTALQLAHGLSLSLIAGGVYAGQWALHYPEIPYVLPMPWQGQCPKSVIRAPGFNPSQNPGQFATCKALPSKFDLCGGNPLQDDCRPKPPLPWKWSQPPQDKSLPPLDKTEGQATVAAPPPQAGKRPTFSLEAVPDQPDVFIMLPDATEAKVVFVHADVEVIGDEDNAARCAKNFFALARTVDEQESAACFIKPAPAASEDGKLSCGVSVRFEDAQTYIDKVCNITAVFRESGGHRDSVQVIKR